VIKYFVGTGADDARVLSQLLDEVLQHAASRGIHLLTGKVQPLHLPAFTPERYEFLLMDTLPIFLDFHACLSTKSVRHNASKITGSAGKSGRSAWCVLTETAFANISADTTIPKCPPARHKVYQSGCAPRFSDAANWILIAEVNGRIAGYSVWKKASALEVKHSFDIARCTLAGIHPEFFGRGLYTRLTFEGMRIAQKFANHLDGPAHVSHYPVHRAMLKLGWKLAGVRHSFHKWLND
jgi:hypothetical protein